METYTIHNKFWHFVRRNKAVKNMEKSQLFKVLFQTTENTICYVFILSEKNIFT